MNAKTSKRDLIPRVCRKCGQSLVTDAKGIKAHAAGCQGK